MRKRGEPQKAVRQALFQNVWRKYNEPGSKTAKLCQTGTKILTFVRRLSRGRLRASPQPRVSRDGGVDPEVRGAAPLGRRTKRQRRLARRSRRHRDWHAIDADAELASGTRIGQRMLHGAFGIAHAVSMSANLLTLRNPAIAALGIRKWTFKALLFIDDTVHLALTITDKKVTSDGRRVVLGRKLALAKHDGTVAQEGFADLMVALEAA